MNRRLLGGIVGLAVSLGAWGGSVPAAEPTAVALNAADADLLNRVSGYLNQIETLKAHFNQISPDGSLQEGLLTMERPGRMRFEYQQPTPLLVVADGTFVVVHDKDRNSTDRYPLNATPLDAILENKVNLAKDLLVTHVEDRGGVIRLTARDRAEPGKGEVTLVLDDQPMALRQWVVTDAQGMVTTVSLDDLHPNVPVDPRQFIFNDQGPKPRRGR